MSEAEFLNEVREYIEDTEEICDGEWGYCRPREQLIAEGKMPKLYAEVLRRIAALGGGC